MRGPCRVRSLSVLGHLLVQLCRPRCLMPSFLISALLYTPQLLAAEPSPAELRQARKDFGRAVVLQNKSDWEGALTLFLKVSQIKTTPQILFNIAFCQSKLNQLVASKASYERAISIADKRKHAKVIKEAKVNAGDLEARIPKLTIKVVEPSASVVLDARELETAELQQPVLVDPGSHQVTVTAEGYEPFTTSFTISEGEKREVDARLQKIDKPETPTPPSKPPPKESAKGAPTLAYFATGVGVGAAVATGVFLVLRANTISELDDRCGASRNRCPPTAQGTIDRGETFTTLANVSAAVSVVGLGVGISLILTSSGNKKTGLSTTAPGAPLGLSYGGDLLKFGRLLILAFLMVGCSFPEYVIVRGDGGSDAADGGTDAALVWDSKKRGDSKGP